MNKKEALEITATVAKGLVSSIPGVGGLFAGFISKAEETTLELRRQEWMTLVDARLDRLQERIDKFASNDFYVTIAQKTTTLAYQAHSKERRAQFANMLANSFSGIDIDQDKQLMFIHLLDQLTPISVTLLKHFSEDHYNENDYVRGAGMLRVYTVPGTEHFLVYLASVRPEFKDRRWKSFSTRLLPFSLFSYSSGNVHCLAIGCNLLIFFSVCFFLVNLYKKVMTDFATHSNKDCVTYRIVNHDFCYSAFRIEPEFYPCVSAWCRRRYAIG